MTAFADHEQPCGSTNSLPGVPGFYYTLELQTLQKELLDDRFSDSPGKTPENLCLDAGYVGKQNVAVSHGYELHI